MASSGSIKRAQAIKLCDLCQEDNIKWRCIECDKLMCEKCRTIHLRVPVTAKHQIVTIATPMQQVQRKITVDNIPCKDHTTKMMCLYCKPCNRLVCPDCVSIDHPNHKFVSIESVLEDKLSQLRDMEGKLTNKMNFCDKKSQELGDLTTKFNSIFDESVIKIKQREKELKDVICQYSKRLQEKVEDDRSKCKDIASKIKNELEQVKRKLEYQKLEVESALAFSNSDSLLKVKMQIADFNFTTFPTDIEHFVSCTELIAKTIPELFGSFQKMTIPVKEQDNVEFKVLRTFKTDLSSICKIVPIDEATAFISQAGLLNKQVVRKVKIKENEIITLQAVSCYAEDMALTPNDKILLADWNSSKVKLLTKSGKVQHFLNLESKSPKSICVTRNNIIVGVIEAYSTYLTPDNNHGQLFVFDMEGNWEKTIPKDGNEKLLNLPHRITKNINQDMIVIDRTSGTTGRVVALDKNGDLRWVYTGSPQINAVKGFNPLGIETTSQGQIIVSDVDTNAFHVLSQDGDLLSNKIVSRIGIDCPLSMDFDKTGQLWVGCGGGKIHIVKIN